jgi:hypothetical protein
VKIIQPLTDGKLDRKPEPNPSNVHLFHVRVVDAFVHASEYAAPNNSDGDCESHKRKYGRECDLLSHTDSNVPENRHWKADN